MLVVGTALLLGMAGASHYGHPPTPVVGLGIAVIVCGVFGLQAIGDTRRSIEHLATTR